MISKNIYAAIDLGSATARGMVGYRNSEGRIVPLGYDEKSSSHCIRTGYILNIDEASAMIRSIVDKLNGFLEENIKIDRVYVGFGGRSLASKHYVVKRSFDGDGRIIGKAEIDDLWQEVRSLNFEGKEILHIDDPLYSVNGVQEIHPQGILCRELEAKFQVLTSRPQHARTIREMVRKAGLDLAGIIISPLAEASVVLTSEERALGCCYINLGAGCTSVSIYKNGLLAMLQVIPLGGINVTKDIESLRLVRPDAELIKLQKASMQTEGIKDKKIRMTSPDRQTEREIPLVEVNRLASARMREITVNFLNIIRVSGLQNGLGAGIVIGGGGVKLKLYIDILRDQLEEVRIAQLRPDTVDWLSQEPARADSLITPVGLLNLAEEGCTGPAKNLQQMMDEVEPVEPEDLARNPYEPSSPDSESSEGTRTILIDLDESDSPETIRSRRKKKEPKSNKHEPKRFGVFFDKVLGFFSGDEDTPDEN